MRVALAQLNPTVGHIDGNLALALQAIDRANQENIDLVVLPELTLLGYPPRDLLMREDLLDSCEQALAEFTAACTRTAALIGVLTPNTTGAGLPLFNSIALCQDGQIAVRQNKCLLPNYDVFDERRYFQPGDQVGPVPFTPPGGGPGLSLGLTICEDLWNEPTPATPPLYRINPVEHLAAAGVDGFANISASPFWIGKQPRRQAMFARQIQNRGRFLLYTNQVGGNDDLIFDGASLVLGSDGAVLAQGRAFEEDFVVVDLNAPQTARIEPYPDHLDSLLSALVLGTRDYVHKCGFKDVVIGVSGGIDSAVTAAVAAQAIGPQHVHTVAMPSRFSSDHSLDDARQLAANLDTEFREIPIQTMHAAAEATMLPHFEGLTADTTEENLQARIRGQILMALSNKFGWLVLSTGNKSELAVGYCTLYGDMCGGLAILSDVSKTSTFRLAERINARSGRDIIPRNTLTKPPSAELRPNQTDQDSLPPYDVLDEILARYVELQEAPAAIVDAGFDPVVVSEVIRRVDLNEYKRRQAAPGLKVTARAFGVGWRMPIAAKLQTQRTAPKV